MFEASICQIIFYIFALLALVFAAGVVIARNPVTSAMCMALCFGMVAAIFFGLGAQFLGIVQIIVYAGAILVLFLFVVMMLDVKTEEKVPHGWLKPTTLGGVFVGAVFAAMILNISLALPGAKDGTCPAKALVASVSELAVGEPQAAAAPAVESRFGGVLPALEPASAARVLHPGLAPEQAVNSTDYPDVKLLGQNLFTRYNIPFVILGFALLSGTVGAMALARKIRKD